MLQSDQFSQLSNGLNHTVKPVPGVQIVERGGQKVRSKCKLFLDTTPDCTKAKYYNVNFYVLLSLLIDKTSK